MKFLILFAIVLATASCGPQTVPNVVEKVDFFEPQSSLSNMFNRVVTGVRNTFSSATGTLMPTRSRRQAPVWMSPRGSVQIMRSKREPQRQRIQKPSRGKRQSLRQRIGQALQQAARFKRSPQLPIQLIQRLANRHKRSPQHPRELMIMKNRPKRSPQLPIQLIQRLINRQKRSPQHPRELMILKNRPKRNPQYLPFRRHRSPQAYGLNTYLARPARSPQMFVRPRHKRTPQIGGFGGMGGGGFGGGGFGQGGYGSAGGMGGMAGGGYGQSTTYHHSSSGGMGAMGGGGQMGGGGYMGGGQMGGGQFGGMGGGLLGLPGLIG